MLARALPEPLYMPKLYSSTPSRTPSPRGAEDCTVTEAVPHVARLLRRRTKEIGLVLAAILALMVMATGVSILATAALGLIAFVPFVGLAALPLQVIAWMVRGFVFQFVGLTGVATYIRLHGTLQVAVTPSARVFEGSVET